MSNLTFTPRSKGELKDKLREIVEGKSIPKAWDLRNIEDFEELFKESYYSSYEFGARFSFISNWDVRHVRDMNSMFSGCTNFNLPLNGWNVDNVRNMESMFSGCTNFNQPLNDWNIKNVRNMKYMFSGCEKFNQPLTKWVLDGYVSIAYMFSNCSISIDNMPVIPLPHSYFDRFRKGRDELNQYKFKFENVSYLYNASYIFLKLKIPIYLSQEDVDTSITRVRIKSKWSSIKNLNDLQIGTEYIVESSKYSNSYENDIFIGTFVGVDEQTFDGIKLKGDMNLRNPTFTPRSKGELQNKLIDIARGSASNSLSWDLSNIADLSDLFSSNHFSSIDFNIFSFISDWNVSHVTNMKGMFKGCMRFNLPLNNWVVSNVTNMENMFEECTSFNNPLDNWIVSSVTNMKGMFDHCNKFNQPLNNWVVSSVTNMKEMFKWCQFFNQPLNNWDVSKVTNMKNMFEKCSKFNQPLNNWVLNNLEMYNDDYKMFDGCPISNENKPQRIKKLEQLELLNNTNRPLKYAYFDNSLTMPEITAIKQSFLNILNTQGFDNKGSIKLKLNRISDYFESNDINDVNIHNRFCDPNSMNTDYIFGSINSQHYILLVSYYENLQDIHAMMTIEFEENQHGSIGVYLDAFCVNNVMRYKGARLLLTKLIDALELMPTPNIEYIRLSSVPTQNTLDFYKRNNFQITTQNKGLIQHTRPIVRRTVTVASPSNVVPGGSLTRNKHTSNSFQKNELLSVLTKIIEMKKKNDSISNPSTEGVEVDNIIIPLRVHSKGSPPTKKRHRGKKTVRKIKKHIRKI